jgi:hypothetical protein
MRKTLCIALAAFSGCMVMGQSADSDAPEWVYKIRMISIPHKPRKGDFDPEALKAQLETLKKSGVNTIMDHGSMQFLDGLPDGRGQWKTQVNYDVALPYSKAVKDAGFKLFHHTTSTFVPIEAMDNPEYRKWVSEDIRTGKPSMRPPKTSYSDACFMDMNHPGFRAKVFARMAEYAQKCNVDGWMTDEVEWLSDIYAGGNAEGSGKLYRERFGKGYPSGSFNPELPEWREYIAFRYDSGGEFFKGLLSSLREVKPQMALSSCLAGISKYHRRIWAMGNENWLKGLTLGFFEMEEGFHPRKKAAGYLSTTYWPAYYREMALYNANGEVNGWPCSYSLGYPSLWGIDNSEQFYLWALTLSMGHRYWMRDYQAEPQWFAWEEKHEKDLIKPLLSSDIGVFFPELARDYVPKTEIPYQNWSGFSEALAWHNLPADQLVRAHFDDVKRLSRFKMIFLPSAGFVSEQMADTLKKYVENGGIVVASGECFVQDPFSAERSKNDKLQQLLGVASVGEWNAKPASFRYHDAVHVYPDGMLKVEALPSAKVEASVQEAGPALIVNTVGKGKTFYFTGNWGIGMHNIPYQKTARYRQSFQPAQREALAQFVRKELNQNLRAEVRGLPSKVLFNVYDTDGDFDGQYRRTLHLLDSFDGYEPGETFPETNQPCRFKPFSERNGGKPIEFVLRDLKKVNGVKLISPDFEGEKKFAAQYSKADNGFVVSIPSAEFGRYSVVVVDKE